MNKETKENLKKALADCVLSEQMKRVVAKSELENLNIQMQDRMNPMHRALYRFDPYEGRFVERTGMSSSYKAQYNPEEFVETLQRYHYMVTVKQLV